MAKIKKPAHNNLIFTMAQAKIAQNAFATLCKSAYAPLITPVPVVPVKRARMKKKVPPVIYGKSKKYITKLLPMNMVEYELLCDVCKTVPAYKYFNIKVRTDGVQSLFASYNLVPAVASTHNAGIWMPAAPLWSRNNIWKPTQIYICNDTCKTYFLFQNGLV